MSQSQSPETSPSDTTSVENASPKYLLDINVEDDRFFTVKCTSCETLTCHEWVIVQPTPQFDVTNAIEEVIKKSRKILMCTVCAKLSLKS